MSAGFTQAVDEGAKHLFDFNDISIKLIEHRFIQKIEVLCQHNIVFKFAADPIDVAM